MSFKSLIADRLRQAAEALDEGVAATPDTIDEKRSTVDVLDEYVSGLPLPQNAVDVLPGWNMALPPQTGAIAGPAPFYADPRIIWALNVFGPLTGKSVLELGPLEASHTFMLEQAGPARLQAIEANRLSFLRCLVVKELLGLKIARFYLGDFQSWLTHHHERYDLIVASGVLYHMLEPVRLLELIAARTDAFYLWTHYMSDAAMPPGDPRREAFDGEASVVESHGVSVRQYRRSYLGAWRQKSFCGGMLDTHHWLDRDDILALISAVGFDDVRIAHDQPDHQNGPAFSIFARRMNEAVSDD